MWWYIGCFAGGCLTGFVISMITSGIKKDNAELSYNRGYNDGYTNGYNRAMFNKTRGYQ